MPPAHRGGPSIATPGPSKGQRWAFRLERETQIVLLIAAVQFVTALDFVMVLPMGPDLARGLGASPSQTGLIASSYALAACISGLFASSVLDKFDRKRALGVCLIGLVTGTLFCGLAPDLPSLLAARFATGAFAGPLTAVGLAVVSDQTSPKRRGRAVAKVIAAASASAVFGVPAGVILSEFGGWRAPFVAVAGIGAVVAVLVFMRLPSMIGHIGEARLATLTAKIRMITSPVGLAAGACIMMAAASEFVMVANIASHIQVNLGLPRSAFGGLYLVGGLSSLAVSTVSGRLIDRIGAGRVMLISNALFAVVVWELFVRDADAVPVVVLFMGCMMAGALRWQSAQTVMTRIPPLDKRAAFLSVTGAMQQLGAALGSGLSSVFLVRQVGDRLDNMDMVGWTSIGLTLTVGPMLIFVERLRRGVHARAVADEGASQPHHPDS